MPINNFTKRQLAFMIGGSFTGSAAYMMIGTGSQTYVASQDALVTATDRQLVTTLSYPATQKVKWQVDWNSVEMSGTTLTEFGITGSAATTTGSMWSVAVIPSTAFDGSNELRIEETWEVV